MGATLKLDRAAFIFLQIVTGALVSLLSGLEALYLPSVSLLLVPFTGAVGMGFIAYLATETPADGVKPPAPVPA